MACRQVFGRWRRQRRARGRDQLGHIPAQHRRRGRSWHRGWPPEPRRPAVPRRNGLAHNRPRHRRRDPERTANLPQGDPLGEDDGERRRQGGRSGRARKHLCCSPITTRHRRASCSTRPRSPRSTSATRTSSRRSRRSRRSGGARSPDPSWASPRALTGRRGPAIAAIGLGISTHDRDRRHVALGDRARRQRQPVRVRGRSRARGDAPRKAGSRPAGVAGVGRRRGDPSGRNPRLHGAPCLRARP